MEWWDAVKRPPNDMGRYLVTDGYSVEIMYYFGFYQGYPDWSSYNCNTLDVLYWARLPKAPDAD